MAKQVSINGHNYDCVDCRRLESVVPARKSHLKPGARRQPLPFDPSSTKVDGVAWLVVTLQSGEILYVTTRWAEFLFRQACSQGENFDSQGKPKVFSYDKNCVDFYCNSKAAYEHGELRSLHGNDTIGDFSDHYRLPYMVLTGDQAKRVRGIEVLEDPSEMERIWQQLGSKSTDTHDRKIRPIVRHKDSLKQLNPRRGDILAASRMGGIYEHYAVYVGEGRIIHYAAANGDFGLDICVHEAPLEEFERGAAHIEILQFPNDPHPPTNDNPNLVKLLSRESWFFELARAKDYHVYSPDETVARARSRLGENKYSLPTNNCEHFALWCKTGVSESHQINAWLTAFAKLGLGSVLRLPI